MLAASACGGSSRWRVAAPFVRTPTRSSSLERHSDGPDAVGDRGVASLALAVRGEQDGERPVVLAFAAVAVTTSGRQTQPTASAVEAELGVRARACATVGRSETSSSQRVAAAAAAAELVVSSVGETIESGVEAERASGLT